MNKILNLLNYTYKYIQPNKMNILDLNKDCIELITIYLNNKDLIAFGTSCRKLHELFNIKINKINIDYLEKQVKLLSSSNYEYEERIENLEVMNSFLEKKIDIEQRRGRKSRSKSPKRNIRSKSPKR
jgi:hypothetical protein